MDKKLYSPTEQDLVLEWCEKWFELSIMINEVTGTDEPPWSPPPPSEIDELSYQSLRFWFFDRQEQFIPLWADFRRCNSGSLFPDCESEDKLDPEDVKYRTNPCLYFYEPENLYRFAQHLDLQSGEGLWEPSEYRASLMRPLLVKMGQLIVEFTDWVNDRTYEPEEDTLIISRMISYLEEHNNATRYTEVTK